MTCLYGLGRTAASPQIRLLRLGSCHDDRCCGACFGSGARPVMRPARTGAPGGRSPCPGLRLSPARRPRPAGSCRSGSWPILPRAAARTSARGPLGTGRVARRGRHERAAGEGGTGQAARARNPGRLGPAVPGARRDGAGSLRPGRPGPAFPRPGVVCPATGRARSATHWLCATMHK